MKTIEVSLGARSYPIIVGTGLVDSLGDHLPEGKIAVISTPIIMELYGDTLETIGREYVEVSPNIVIGNTQLNFAPLIVIGKGAIIIEQIFGELNPLRNHARLI